MNERIYVVDRIEGDRVVLVADGGAEAGVEVDRSELPEGVEEGSVLRVPAGEGSGDDSVPAWLHVVLDAEETARRRGEAAARIEALRKRDPGGDVVL